jgi:DNA-binding SARP family transcriptional activator
VAAHHYREAGDIDSVAAVVAAAIPEIMGSGQYVAASELVDRVPRDARSVGLNLVRSRTEMQRGEFDRAIALSRTVLDTVDAGTSESDHALLNLVTMHMHAGQGRVAIEYAKQLQQTATNEYLRQIATGMSLMIAASSSGSLATVARQLLNMAERQRGTHPHYFGVTMLNLAITTTQMDNPRLALEYATQAIDSLQETSSSIEISSALMAKATVLTMLGSNELAQQEADRAAKLGQIEAVLERADLADTFHNPDDALALLESVDGTPGLNGNDRRSLALQTARYLARRGRHDEAMARLIDVDWEGEGSDVGQTTRQLLTLAYVAVAAGADDRDSLVEAASRAAKHQEAEGWRRVAALLKSHSTSGIEFSRTVESIGATSPWIVTSVADLVGQRLDDLDEAASGVVAAAVAMHPGRWRFVLRALVAGASHGEGLKAARFLESVGERSDIRRLRAYARRQRRVPGTYSLGRSLARRLADQVYVEDQNRVTIHVGSRQVAGSTVRRKVLALLCFLLTRPEMASTRDQVLEALWPDLDPLDALNSLNQTVYFLRRVLEEDYVDDLSPGYLHHDSDLIWLDSDLVTSRSNECRRLIKALPITPTPDDVLRLADRYQGRFALDFEYEEWAAPFRDWLHASFLEIIERAVSGDIESGHFDRGISLARRVLEGDPSAEQVEVSLLRLYRASGAHAAAAEQYAHYAEVMREQLGVEPPPLEAL